MSRPASREWTVTAEEIERADRILQEPFASDRVWYTIFDKPVARDDGLFFVPHRGYVPCPGCQPDPMTGEAAWNHAHIVIEGSNGGVRCEPLTEDSMRQLVRDVLYRMPDALSIQPVPDTEGQPGVAVVCSTGPNRQELPLAVTEAAADALARGDDNALDRLIARNQLFEDGGGSS